MTNIEELTLVVPFIDEIIYFKIKEDLIETKISFTEVGLIEGHGIFTLNEVFMPSKKMTEIYFNGLNEILTKWKDFDPYIDEGGIK